MEKIETGANVRHIDPDVNDVDMVVLEVQDGQALCAMAEGQEGWFDLDHLELAETPEPEA